MSIVPALVQICEREWQFFDRSRINLDGTSIRGKKEYEDGAYQRIGDYWQVIGGAYKNLTGKDRGTPWSAAFISWCMHEAQAGKQFPYSAAHCIFINSAIKNAMSGETSAPLVGQRLKGYKLKVGDLICYWYGRNEISYDTARQIG